MVKSNPDSSVGPAGVSCGGSKKMVSADDFLGQGSSLLRNIMGVSPDVSPRSDNEDDVPETKKTWGTYKYGDYNFPDVSSPLNKILSNRTEVKKGGRIPAGGQGVNATWVKGKTHSSPDDDSGNSKGSGFFERFQMRNLELRAFPLDPKRYEISPFDDALLVRPSSAHGPIGGKHGSSSPDSAYSSLVNGIASNESVISDGRGGPPTAVPQEGGIAISGVGQVVVGGTQGIGPGRRPLSSVKSDSNTFSNSSTTLNVGNKSNGIKGSNGHPGNSGRDNSSGNVAADKGVDMDQIDHLLRSLSYQHDDVDLNGGSNGDSPGMPTPNTQPGGLVVSGNVSAYGNAYGSQVSGYEVSGQEVAPPTYNHLTTFPGGLQQQRPNYTTMPTQATGYGGGGYGDGLHLLGPNIQNNVQRSGLKNQPTRYFYATSSPAVKNLPEFVPSQDKTGAVPKTPKPLMRWGEANTYGSPHNGEPRQREFVSSYGSREQQNSWGGSGTDLNNNYQQMDNNYQQMHNSRGIPEKREIRGGGGSPEFKQLESDQTKSAQNRVGVQDPRSIPEKREIRGGGGSPEFQQHELGQTKSAQHRAGGQGPRDAERDSRQLVPRDKSQMMRLFSRSGGIPLAPAGTGGNWEFEPYSPTAHLDPTASGLSLERAARCHRNSAAHNEAAYTWSGHLPTRSQRLSGISSKVFLGGVPWDITEEGLIDTFRAFGPVRVEWPGKENAAVPKGYLYVIFEQDKQVRSLLSACTHDYGNGGGWYYKVSSRGMGNKEVQVIPWFIADSGFVRCQSQRLDPQKTVFVGALHGMLNAEGLSNIFNDLFGGVIYAGIDTDKYKYPIGSARVTFGNYRSYMRAVSGAFIEIKTPKFTKKVQVDPYLCDALCKSCGIRQGPYFCRDLTCFKYFCRSCWELEHEFMAHHKPLMRNCNKNRNINNPGGHSGHPALGYSASQPNYQQGHYASGYSYERRLPRQPTYPGFE